MDNSEIQQRLWAREVPSPKFWLEIVIVSGRIFEMRCLVYTGVHETGFRCDVDERKSCTILINEGPRGGSC